MKLVSVFSSVFLGLAYAGDTPINYPLKDAAFEVSVYFIKNDTFANQLFNHGCWCSKLVDPTNIELGGTEAVDELDQICKEWAKARKCLVSSGGVCENYGTDLKSDTYMIETTLLDGGLAVCNELNSDDCKDSTCKIDVEFALRINELYEQTEGGLELSVSEKNCPKCTDCSGVINCEAYGNTTPAPTSITTSGTTRYVVPGFALSFKDNWGWPENTAPGGVSSDTATGLSYSPATGSFVPSENPTKYTLGSIDIDMTIEKAHSCSDHVVILKTGTGKPDFDWSAAADEVMIAWNCDWPQMEIGWDCYQFSETGFYDRRDYEWDLKMDASGVRMYIDGVLVFTCPAPSWYGSPFYIWIGSDNDPGEAEDGVSAYGNYRKVEISDVVTRSGRAETPVGINATVPHATSNIRKN